MNLAALVLAAGSGRRFGGDKLLARWRGLRLIDHAIAAALAAPVARVIVVAPPELELPDERVEPVRLQSAALSQSLQAGAAAAGALDGLFVFLGDMPLVPHAAAAALVPLLAGHYAALPRFAGQPGHPVLLSPAALGDLASLAGDEGAGRLLRGRADLAWLDWPDASVTIDVDRAEDLARLG